MDNDVMFGKPRSRFDSVTIGKKKYENGEITPDLYALQNAVKIKGGKVKLQIREIEPETSALDHIRLHVLNLKENERLFVKSDFGGHIIASSDEVSRVTSEANINVTDTEGTPMNGLVSDFLDGKKHDLLMKEGDSLEIKFNKVGDGQQYLLLESWYRDWTLGELFIDSAIVSPLSRLYTGLKIGVAVSFITSMFGLTGAFSGGARDTQNSGANLIADAFALPTAQADHTSCSSCTNCRSLIITSNNKAAGGPVTLEIVEPRYAKPDVVAVKIPTEAFDGQGIAHIRIQASKKHKVSGIAIVASDEEQSVGESLKLTKATLDRTGVDHADILANAFDRKYVETLPGDILDLEFEISEEPKGNHVFMLAVGGVYALATKEEQLRAGNWTRKLDRSARRFLRTVYEESKVNV